MAYQKKERKNAGFERLKADLASGSIGPAYLFYGEETYLREHYLGLLREKLIHAGSEAFNLHVLESPGLQALTEAAEAMPMLAERTLVIAVDLDLFRLSGEQQGRLAALLEDLPDSCCLVFVFDTVEYSPRRKAGQEKKKDGEDALRRAIADHVTAVEFRPAESGELLRWTARRFQALGKEIDRQTAEHLIFTCGDLMTGLVQEIEKTAAYAKGPAITKADIDAVVIPVLSAEVFRLCDAVVQGNDNRAAALLGDLLKMQTEPIRILAALGSQLRKLWTARLALDSGRDRAWLMDLWSMKSDYPAKLLLNAARRTTAAWCADGVKQCQVLDRRMKSQADMDSAGELKLLLVRLAAGRR